MNDVPEDFLKGLAAGAGKINLTDIKKSLSPSSANLLTSLDNTSASYFTSPPGFVLDMDSTTATHITFHMHSMGLVGRNHVVNLYIYSLKDVPAEKMPLLNKDALSDPKPLIASMTSSFSLDSSQKIPFREPIKPELLIGIVVGALAGFGLVIAVIVLIIWLALRKPRPRPTA